MRAFRILSVALLAGIAAALLSATGPQAQYTPDGYDYSIMMLMDRGIPYVQAEAQAEAFYAHQPVAKVAGVARWLHGRPEYWNLFSVRRLYPWVASLLYPYRGFDAMIDVSRASYVATAVLVVLLAIRIAPLTWSFVLSIALSLFPPWRDYARCALTDPMAVALVAGTLLAGAALLSKQNVWRVVVFAALCGLLTFTRPIPYIILGAGIIAGIAAPRTGDRKRLAAAAWITGIAAVWTAIVEAALAHANAPSFRWIVADTYQHFLARGYAPPGESLGAFYVREEIVIAGHALVKGILGVVPLLAIAGMVLRRRDPAMPLLAGACAATWLGALVDPDRFDVLRCIVMPVAPAIAAFAAAAFADIASVPRRLGLPALRVRYSLPGRPLVRNTTVKE